MKVTEARDARAALARAVDPVGNFRDLDAAASLPLVRLAAAHRVSTYLAERFPDEPSLRALLMVERVQERVRRKHDLVVLDRLGKITEPIVLKGIVSQRLLNPDAPRRSGDLDVLVPEVALDAVTAELLAMGYTQDESFLSIADYRRLHHHDAPFVLAGDVAHTVEVHRHPLRNPVGSHVPVDRFFEGAIQMLSLIHI